ncbi:steryl acetyl hydrolase [Nocardia yunnanensis]|uniref:Steryl acetyl hydrolase n=1 Tax=Nocardia yunnanensis TaxID=2382165 RepID=A0A386ZHX1_9NOCA|nr:alpha/beta hydrolase [Nocardia yunnanensis]AYF76793.1 steryl acetyl hydrolase [Nocardia yunnanensis]
MSVPQTVPVAPQGGSVQIELASRASLTLRVAHALLRATVRPGLDKIAILGNHGPLRGAPAFRIANLAELIVLPLRAPRGTLRRPVRYPDFRAEWLWHKDIPGPEDTGRGAILYFHGGGFVAGGLHSHRRLVARIARVAALPALAVDYRQLPKGHITESVADAVHAYRSLLDQGFAPEKIVFAGDSAGGGLTFAAALAARDQGLPVPGAIAAIAPWADFDPSIRRAHPNDRTDAMLSAFSLSVPVLVGFARDGELDPSWSPVNHEFTGMPPVLIQVGSTEVLLPDAEALARRCAAAGVPCTLQIWDRAIHVFQAGADILPDARAAIAELGTFIGSAVAAGHRGDRDGRASAA